MNGCGSEASGFGIYDVRTSSRDEKRRSVFFTKIHVLYFSLY